MTKCSLLEEGEVSTGEIAIGGSSAKENDFSNRGSEAGFLFEMLLISHETLAMQFAAESAVERNMQ